MNSVKRILMLRGHSVGIGDLLRSSAAWRALKDHFGASTQLHLALFTKDPGYPAETFISRQALLNGVTVVPKTESGWHGWRKQLRQLDALVGSFKPDLIIDFEAHGMRTASLSAFLGWRHGLETAGIAQFPGRGWFYRTASPRARFKVPRPDGPGLREVDYTDRDFAVLAALGLRRDGRPIEMSLTPAAVQYGRDLRHRLGLAPETPLIGINIGCGTPGAAIKRPGTAMLKVLANTAMAATGGALVMTGAPDERHINQAFLAETGLAARERVFDLCGQTDLDQLGGLIDECRLFITSDSGPYHMAVGRRRPTLVLFNWANHQAFHDEPWVRRIIRGADGQDDPAAARSALEDLLRESST